MDTEGTMGSGAAVSGVGCFTRSVCEREESPSRPIRVLLVDDNADVLGVISKILTRLGYDVISAGNGTEGLAVHREKHCQVVLTDLEMPFMDGLTLARRIKAECPFIPVVIMTGSTLAGSDLSQATAGSLVDDVLYKPIRLLELQRAVQRLLPRWPNR